MTFNLVTFNMTVSQSMREFQSYFPDLMKTFYIKPRIYSITKAGLKLFELQKIVGWNKIIVHWCSSNMMKIMRSDADSNDTIIIAIPVTHTEVEFLTFLISVCSF